MKRSSGFHPNLKATELPIFVRATRGGDSGTYPLASEQLLGNINKALNQGLLEQTQR
jgi:hypothetical protein